MRRQVWVSLSLLLGVALVIVGCPFPGPSLSGSLEYVVRSDRIVLAWDPSPSALSGSSDGAVYQVYYRPHRGSGWIFLGEAPSSDSPEFSIWHKDVGDGRWEFGVVTVFGTGSRSTIHSSLDERASPFGGWYVKWEGSNR